MVYNLKDYSDQTLSASIDLSDDPIRLSTALIEFVNDGLIMDDLIDPKLVRTSFSYQEK